MCGISGVINFNASAVDPHLLKRMTDIISHRGPDDEGFYIEDGVGLGMRRLSIIDLHTGHQPIHSEDKSIWTVLNGEIYNFRQLRAELQNQNHHFYTKSDTEVLVHLYEQYSESFVDKLKGMFAFAIWDKKRQKLLLGRDRFGIKPLYYCQTQDQLIFGSEIKSILQVDTIPREVELEALDAFLTLRYVPAPLTMFKGILKLPPAHLLVIEKNNLQTKQYWDLNIKEEARRPEQYYTERLNELLKESVASQLVSDVPLGLMLSGGIDSSTIAALMTEMKSGTLKTFTVGFQGADRFNELDDARAVAKHFGTDHYEVYTTADQHIDFLPRFIWHLDEPIGNFSAVTFNFISELAGKHVKVALSGQGADELFAGYKRYVGDKLAGYYQLLPGVLRENLITGLVNALPRAQLAKRAVRALGENDFKARFLSMNSVFSPQMKLALFSNEVKSGLVNQGSLECADAHFDQTDALHALDKSLYVDTKMWLPDDMLTTFDKMSMANSLEVRVPFLDEDLADFVATIPAGLKLHRFTTKYILKQAVQGLIPENVIKKKKKGFPAPMNDWFRKDMKRYLTDILFSDECRARPYFNHRYVENLVQLHLAGKEDFGRQLFCLLCFELWHRIFIDQTESFAEFTPNTRPLNLQP